MQYRRPGLAHIRSVPIEAAKHIDNDNSEQSEPPSPRNGNPQPQRLYFSCSLHAHPSSSITKVNTSSMPKSLIEPHPSNCVP
jgi:hypothetical protein